MENQIKKSRSNTFPRSTSTTKDVDYESEDIDKVFDSPKSEAKLKPRSISNNRSSYSFSSNRKYKQERTLNPSKLTKITNNFKTKFLTVRDESMLRRYDSEDRLDNESTISTDTKNEFMDNIKHEDEVLITGIRKFNLRPKQGIDYFIEHNFITERTPKAVAEFLYKECQNTEDKVNEHWQLDKKNIGLYLGDVDDFNVKVLDEFVKLHNFEGLQCDSALRIFLEEFFLPGESQIIDRMMQKFAYHFCSQNKDAFRSPDTAYVLAFSIILLNTDLHNPSIKRKMSKEEFIKNNKGIDNGEDLPIEYLSYIYDNISKNEIKSKTGDIELDTTKSIAKILNDISYSFTNPNMEGWLYKRGGIGKKQWKKKWCVVANSCMYFFPNKNKEKTIGILPLCDLTVSKYEFENSSPSSNTQYLFSNIIKNFTKTRYYFIIKAKPKKEQELMRKVSAQNSPDGESIPNFAITDNNQKVLYSKHVNGRVIADIQDYYIFAVDTKEECEYWVYIIESQIHDSMAAYRSLAAVKRHSLIQKKDINDPKTANSSDTDIIFRSPSENSQATKIAKDNYIYNTGSNSSIQHHNTTTNKTFVNEKGNPLSSYFKSSNEKINSNADNSLDHTYENLADNSCTDNNIPKSLSLNLSEIGYSSIKEQLDEHNSNDDLNRVEIIPLNDIDENQELKKDKEKENKDKDNNSRESLYIPREFQKLYTDPNLLSPTGILSTTNDDSSSSHSSTSSPTSKPSNINENTGHHTNGIKNDSSSLELFSLDTFNMALDSILSDKNSSSNNEPNYILSSSNDNDPITNANTNKNRICDINETSITDSAIKENNVSDDKTPNLSLLEFSKFSIKPPDEEKSYEEIEYQDCNEFFDGQSQIPKSEINESKFINENSTILPPSLLK